jgi:hypothetical protein
MIMERPRLRLCLDMGGWGRAMPTDAEVDWRVTSVCRLGVMPLPLPVSDEEREKLINRAQILHEI